MWISGALGAHQILAPGASYADEVTETVDKIWDWLGPLVKQLGYSGILGLITASAFKFVGRAGAITLGLVFIGLQALQHYGYIEIDWGRIQAKVGKRLDVTGDKKFDEMDIKAILTSVLEAMAKGLPNAAGFCAGFLIGLKVM
ncbi:unnamed protein product [Ostreobium quekettii]|uniref:FUN14 family protein n=1 Tax=Ostreobium quekettii TaxID=121088 RepID=A0A8S1J000_9CHLO|nr:unnamed protein product [Ostreobium quekettii]|eukprot:evm.model.scf_550.2 EVM.evm.TU.scf_550.2   scf_550:30147-32119(+)